MNGKKRNARSGSVVESGNHAPPGASRGGTRTVREPATVANVLLAVFLFACRKYLFLSTHKRTAAYLLLLVASVVGDYVRFPRTYFADSGTFVNRYLVKLGWFWTTLWTLSFVVATGTVFRRADGRATLPKHAARLAIATFFWYFWTSAFNAVEDHYGRCSGGRAWTTRSACKSAGLAWNSFDISGHVFILIYSALVMISEARPFVGWDKIQDVLRREEDARRDGGGGGVATTTFSGLGDDELRQFKAVYKRVTPYVQGLFVAITVFVAIWELMLVTTVMYFHSMPEKLLAGIVAMSTWFVTYKVWYASPILPPLPGDGFFKYQALQKSETLVQTQGIKTNINTYY